MLIYMLHAKSMAVGAASINTLKTHSFLHDHMNLMVGDTVTSTDGKEEMESMDRR